MKIHLRYMTFERDSDHFRFGQHMDPTYLALSNTEPLTFHIPH